MVHRAAGAVSVLISRRALVPRVLLNQQSILHTVVRRVLLNQQAILHTVVPRVLRPGR
jgi:hypothetical protein